MLHERQGSVHGGVLPGRSFLELQVKAQAGKECVILTDADHPFAHAVWDENLLEQLFETGFRRQHENAVPELPCPGHGIRKCYDLTACQVIPEPRILGMERGTVETLRECLFLAPGTGLPALLAPPLVAVGGGNQEMVVLKELPVPDQDLPHVKDPFHIPGEIPCNLCIIDPEHIAALQPDGRAFYGIHRDDPGRFSRPLNLHLGANREKIAEDVHGRRVEPCRREPRVPGAAVSQPEPPFPHGV